MSDDVLVKVEEVSKKFCRSLKRSLWYGVQDVNSEMFGRTGHQNELRKNEFWAVNDISFELRRGECMGLIGPNGAGKSTLLKMLNGLVKPDKGKITMRGSVGALIELGAGFNPILTARENIYVNGSVLGLSKKGIDQKFDAIVDFAEIHEFIDTPVQNFSSGMKVRLGFAVASQLNPHVLIVDEVLAVGDFHFRQKCMSKINEMLSDSAILFVSHDMDTIRMFCDRTMVIQKGFSIFDGGTAGGINAYLSLMKDATGNRKNGERSSGPGLFGEIYHNEHKVSSVSHSWTSNTHTHGEIMEFEFEIRLLAKPRNLVIGVPVWDSSGFRVTAFNSDHVGFQFNSNTNCIRGKLQTKCQFNPGTYESCIAIHDGPEILYRQMNNSISVRDQERLFGFATFPQEWSDQSY